ncbi:hypothetical protein M441DRAFT_383910 [Trichoderma asperellum CBS 433.97]|uniref:Uncharacterized protein n=1 Tax=Trichoderma asperellum (strain ATCC 204424 / CBS 433.97 / NBRC 101777) TaxID=1042311 RepID=A0A2T3ZBD9_TRIA4|nr:hypothetical protein M441DRAFT_383910 [Trichoderma asperellum CBS 433.97]PTB42124.1 hypothetical protein M441DRAFT_383910 [Trichoderma asperellum CBS 433.97]
MRFIQIVASAAALATSVAAGGGEYGNKQPEGSKVSSQASAFQSPTVIPINSITYTVTEPTTLTITNCPCTITHPVPPCLLLLLLLLLLRRLLHHHLRKPPWSHPRRPLSFPRQFLLQFLLRRPPSSPRRFLLRRPLSSPRRFLLRRALRLLLLLRPLAQLLRSSPPLLPTRQMLASVLSSSLVLPLSLSK